MSESDEVDRTITVENPEAELQDRLDWAEEQRDGAKEDGVTVDVAYFGSYLQFMHGRIVALERDGVSEEQLLSTHREAREEWENAEDETEDTVEFAARSDVDSHVLQAFFGHGATELGETSRSTVYTDGTIEFVGENGDKVTMQVSGEDDAMAKADLFLRQADRSIDELRDRHGAGLP